MAESIVVSGLVAKHREIAGRIDHHRKEIERLGAGLTHLDATLKLFAPDLDLRSLKPKLHRQRNVVFRPGQVPRFILDALREAVRPLTGHALGEQAVALKGLDSGPETLRAVQKSLTTALKTIAGKGTITEGPMQFSTRALTSPWRDSDCIIAVSILPMGFALHPPIVPTTPPPTPRKVCNRSCHCLSSSVRCTSTRVLTPRRAIIAAAVTVLPNTVGAHRTPTS